MTDPTTRPARRILAVVTILRDCNRYVIDVTTPHGTTIDTAPTTREAMQRAASIVAAMTDEEETT